MVKITPGAGDALRLAGGVLSQSFKGEKMQRAVCDTFALGANALEKGIGFEGREQNPVERIARRSTARRVAVRRKR
jgi:hypothetical protein